jgi:hypothetical protein
MNAFPVFGLTTMSVIKRFLASMPTSAAIF